MSISCIRKQIQGRGHGQDLLNFRAFIDIAVLLDTRDSACTHFLFTLTASGSELGTL